MSIDTRRGYSGIDPETGQIVLEFEINNRLVKPRTDVPGTCIGCGSPLAGNTNGMTIAWEGKVPHLGSFPDSFGSPVCIDCEIFVRDLERYVELGSRGAFRFNVGDIAKLVDQDEYFRVVSRRHDGMPELRTFWPVYTCRLIEVQPGLIPRERPDLELEFSDHKLDTVPAGMLANVAGLSPEAPPPPAVPIELVTREEFLSVLEAPEPLRALPDAPDRDSEIPSLPDCDLPFPATKAIC